jgi:thiosulfate/3-mercaptopyruvate sulfurtransferase
MAGFSPYKMNGNPMTQPPRLIEPEALVEELANPQLLIVDLCSDQLYSTRHIPGAVHVSPKEIVRPAPPANAELPTTEQLSALVSRLGITEDTHVVAYDDEGGGWAGRFLWTLDVIGHHNWSYLNGGATAWNYEGFPVTDEIPNIQPVERTVSISTEAISDVESILKQLGNDDFVIWDARSAGEYDGSKVLAAKGGHIPGAIHCEWTTLMDPQRNLRIREDVAEMLAALGLTPDKKIATHCQSHHRSGFTYLVGRLLGYPAITAYPGSWSEWGNLENTPVETA